jgi:hypothetical protein
MAITSFIDPFGSMVQGYQQGQQTEIQRQQGQRLVRDADYEYQNRLQMDPLRKQYLGAQVDQAIFNHLMDQQQAPFKTDILRENLGALQRAAEVEKATQKARIDAANMDPLVAQATLDARNADTVGARAAAGLTSEQRRALSVENDLSSFTVGGITQNPDIFEASIVGRGGDPVLARQMRDLYFPVTDLSYQYASVYDEMYKKDPVGFGNMPQDQREELAIKEVMRRNPEAKNFNIVPPGQSISPSQMIAQPPASSAAQQTTALPDFE